MLSNCRAKSAQSASRKTQFLPRTFRGSISIGAIGCGKEEPVLFDCAGTYASTMGFAAYRTSRREAVQRAALSQRRPQK